MTDTQITSDTTIYIIGAGDEPQWYAATETPEEAVAYAISGIHISLPQISDSPFRVSKITASEFAKYKGTLEGMRRAEKDADTLRTYDHEKALRLSDVIEGEEADAAMRQLESQLDFLNATETEKRLSKEVADELGISPTYTSDDGRTWPIVQNIGGDDYAVWLDEYGAVGTVNDSEVRWATAHAEDGTRIEEGFSHIREAILAASQLEE